MIVIVIIYASAAIAATVTVSVTAAVTAAIEQKEYDDQNPDDVVVIKNIAKTIHKYPPFAILDSDTFKVI